MSDAPTASPESDEARLTRLRAIRSDLVLFASQCLRVKGKDGRTVPFEMNRAQRFIHERLENQLAETGKVRALILKGRQQGASTYIGARFYHRSSLRRGVNVYILTHEQDATNNLFGMVDRFHKHNSLKPSTSSANAKELTFDKLDSGYSVGTAGATETGRSKTTQLFHGSEAAFWKNAPSHFAGVVQTIPDLPGTEVILESTANGVTGEFYERWQKAEAGDGDYMAIFVPWYWDLGYSRVVPPDFFLDDDEAEYQAQFGLTLGQMVWRRAKIKELKDPDVFKQEYPSTAAEAFQNTGHDSYIPANLVLRARKANLEPFGPKVGGADPAGAGPNSDRFSVAVRQGRKILWVRSRLGMNTPEGANWLKQIIDDEHLSRLFVDVGNMGVGVIDIMHSWGSPYDKIVVAVNFGSSPFAPPRLDSEGKELAGPKNRRAEMWMLSKEWLEDVGGADIPDTDAIQADATGPKYSRDTNQRLILEPKAAMKARKVRSPDEWDAVVLTFAEPVKDRPARPSKSARRGGGPRAGGWMG